MVVLQYCSWWTGHMLGSDSGEDDEYVSQIAGL